MSRVSLALAIRFLAAALCKGNKIDGVEAENGGIEDDDESREGRDDDV